MVKIPQEAMESALKRDLEGVSPPGTSTSYYLMCCSRTVYMLLFKLSEGGETLSISSADLFRAYKDLYNKKRLSEQDYTRIKCGLFLLNNNMALSEGCSIPRFSNRNLSICSQEAGFEFTMDIILVAKSEFTITLKKKYFDLNNEYFILILDDVGILFKKIQQLNIQAQNYFRYLNFSVSFIQHLSQGRNFDNKYRFQFTASLKISQLFHLLDYSKAIRDRRFTFKKLMAEIFTVLSILFGCNMITDCVIFNKTIILDEFALINEEKFLEILPERLVINNQIFSLVYKQEVSFTLNKLCLMNKNYFKVVLNQNGVDTGLLLGAHELPSLFDKLLKAAASTSDVWFNYLQGFAVTEITELSSRDKYLSEATSERLLPVILKYSDLQFQDIIEGLQLEGFSLEQALFNFLSLSHQASYLKDLDPEWCVNSNLQGILFSDHEDPGSGLASVLRELVETKFFNVDAFGNYTIPNWSCYGYRCQSLDQVCQSLLHDVKVLAMDFTPFSVTTTTSSTFYHSYRWLQYAWSIHYSSRFLAYINEIQLFFDRTLGVNFIAQVITEYDSLFSVAFDYSLSKNLPIFKMVNRNILIENNPKNEGKSFRTMPKDKKVGFFSVYSKLLFQNFGIKNKIFIMDISNSHGSIVCDVVSRGNKTKPYEVSWDSISKNLLSRCKKIFDELNVSKADQKVLTSRLVCKKYCLKMLNTSRGLSSINLYKEYSEVKGCWVYIDAVFEELEKKYQFQVVSKLVLDNLKLDIFYSDILVFKKSVNSCAFIGNEKFTGISEGNSKNSKVSLYLRTRESLLLQYFYLRLIALLPDTILLNLQGDSMTLMIPAEDIKFSPEQNCKINTSSIKQFAEAVVGSPYHFTVKHCII